jgi:hypothetical protein
VMGIEPSNGGSFEIAVSAKELAGIFLAKVLESAPCRWEAPTVMTVLAYNKRRVL